MRCPTSAALPLTAYSAACTEHITDRNLVASFHTHGSECALLKSITYIISCINFTHRSERQGRLEKANTWANIEYYLVVRAFGGVVTFFSFVSRCVRLFCESDD